MAFRSTPPAPDCGAASPYTSLLRPRIGLSPERCHLARCIRRENPDLSPAEIVARLGEGATEGDVVLALATIRTRNPRRTRGTINGTLEAGDFIRREGRNDEPVWQTLDRLLGELAQLRAVVAGLGRASRVAPPVLALALLAQTAVAQTSDDAVRSYMNCVRRNAELLEPSGDPPQDVARAAVVLCQREEVAAFNTRGGANAGPASALRDTAVFYGAAQATVARVCRIAQRCGLAPLPNSN